MSNVLGNCQAMTPAQVKNGFITAPPRIAQAIDDLSIQTPSLIRDNFRRIPFENGYGASATQLIYRGNLPKPERGFGGWKKVSDQSGCNDCPPADCSYNLKSFGGSSLQRKVIEFMKRDYVTDSFCVDTIQNTLEFAQVMEKIVENLWTQIAWEQEYNIGFNALTMLAKKILVDADGLKFNTANPYNFRTVGTVRLSAINIDIITAIYEKMRYLSSFVPVGMNNGSPTGLMLISPELLARLYRDDPQVRQDVRFSSMANALVEKYNFVTSVRDMFIPVPYLYMRRWNIVNGELVEVVPYLADIPAEAGEHADINPAYFNATHESVMFMGMYPFDIYYKPTETSLGGGTQFGPQSAMFETLKWVNPQTVEDFDQREGFFATNATIAIAPQYSEALFELVVERPTQSGLASYYPAPICPPESVDCDNSLPAITDCPCPQILSTTYNPVDDNYLIQFSVATGLAAEDEVLLGLTTGGYVTGTVVAVSDDELYATVTLTETGLGNCNFTTVFCVDDLACSAQVVDYDTNCDDATRSDLVLSQPIAAVTASDTVTLILGDGTTVDVTVEAVDMVNNIWTVDFGAAGFCNRNEGIIGICVPTATIARCPGCDGTSFTACTEE